MHKLNRGPAPLCLSRYSYRLGHYWRFLPGGEVVAHTGLSAEDTHRALETIRVFNLNGSLRKIRETYVKGYIHIAEELGFCAHSWITAVVVGQYGNGAQYDKGGGIGGDL